MKKNPLDLSEKEWSDWCSAVDGKSHGAAKILSKIFKHQQLSPGEYKEISQVQRTRLQEEFDWSLPAVDSILSSGDDSDKILITLKDGTLTECVLMPIKSRITVCVSCQVGCRLACTFCQTGRLGLTRNLTSGEILAQLIIARQRLQDRGINQPISNVVFMGMGEPLDNYDEVVKACRILLDTRCFNLSRHRVSISTSGLVPEIRRLADDLPLSFAVSLHAADDAKRTKLMPINRRYPLKDLKEAMVYYQQKTKVKIFVEYIMINGANDTVDDAANLVNFLQGIEATVNLIPFNPHPGSRFTSSTQEQIEKFRQHLKSAGVLAPVRYSRGRDVSAACGQLATKRKEELLLSPRTLLRNRS
ncbi:MAG: 23S rRNA (adenine(2503)-C(2))-methyltransferase RlmN [Chlamydiales bacterium]|nr:23S rRNA (adenine(2503)-C(2))-methyltransferase RlmN [Chlamydiia bacterium]MCP5508275.1 23S rRNA (adenine(2503)-C(2))-methyltransferase RlmN [Chlamydiales bacterium]